LAVIIFINKKKIYVLNLKKLNKKNSELFLSFFFAIFDNIDLHDTLKELFIIFIINLIFNLKNEKQMLLLSGKKVDNFFVIR